METAQKLEVRALSELDHLKVHGRTTNSLSPLTLFWTGSAVECNVRGSELWIEVEASYNLYEPWISIVINSVPVSRQMITSGKQWICVFRGMNKDVIKNVRVVREMQAMSGDPDSTLQIHAVRSDGDFLPVAERPYKLEFIGDSITSGEGATGSKTEDDWIPMWNSAINNYSYMTAEALHADYRVISQSGWGVLTGWDNNPHSNIPQYYEQVCGLVKGEKNKELGAYEENDFESWQPDAVIVNLGTNDGGAFYSPEWKDESTGAIYKQRLHSDGSFHEEDLETFVEAAVQFLMKIRKYNAKAQIVWAYGMLGIPMMPAIYRAVDTYKKRTGDQSVSVFQLPNMTEETTGARSHPGAEAHRKAANELSYYLKEILKSKE